MLGLVLLGSLGVFSADYNALTIGSCARTKEVTAEQTSAEAASVCVPCEGVRECVCGSMRA